jgi:hypothetical protein
MTDRLESFNRSLEDDIRARKQHEVGRQKQLHDLVCRLEREIAEESQVSASNSIPAH